MNSMTRRLVRTELESYLHDVAVWGVAVFFFFVLFFVFMGTVVVQSAGTLSGTLFDLFLLSLGVSSALLAAKVSQRNALEKRPRLFSQLPVSTRQVTFSSWCVRLLWLSIPTVAFSVFLARIADMSFGTFAMVTLATYLGGTTLVATISVGMSINHLPSPVSSWARRGAIACAVIVVVIWFFGNLFVLPSPRPPAVPGFMEEVLPVLIGLLMISGIGLVILDVWLRDRLDDYLG